MQRKTDDSRPVTGESMAATGAAAGLRAAVHATSIPSLVRMLVEGGAVSAAVALVASPRRLVTWAGAGGYEGPHGARVPDLDARFDLASLTKPIMATVALELDRTGLLPLRSTLGRHWPGAPVPLRNRTLSSLLRHRAGLVPWTPLRLHCPGTVAVKQDVAERILTAAELRCGGSGVEGSGVGGGTVPADYSDLGPILWGLTAERVGNAALADLVARHATTPLGMDGVEPSPGIEDDVVACLLDNRVERRLARRQGMDLPACERPPRGVVQDGNARFLGGLAGHAGLFGSARALWRFAAAWMGEAPAVDRAQRHKALAGRGRYALGWERRRLDNSAGMALSARAFGHTGFVGNSLWIDPEQQRIAILLSHRRSSEGDFQSVRRAFHALAVSA